MIEVRRLAKDYDGKLAVRGIDFTVRPGELTAYLGPNGAGKSTTVKMIAGLVRPTDGTIVVCGHDVSSESLEAKRRIGYAPENSALYASLTAEEYLTLVAELHHLAPSVARERMAQMFHLFDLEKVCRRQIETYSRGQRQKVVLSAALLHDPDVLLLDEPLQGLDAHAALALRRLVEGFVQRGKTVLFCSHILDVVERLCQRAIVLNDGQIVADDTMANLLQRSASGTLESVFRQLTRVGEAEEGVQAFLQGLDGKAKT